MSEQAMPTPEAWGEVVASASGITTETLDKLAHELNEAEARYDEAKEVSTDLYNKARDCEQRLVEALNQAGKRKYVVEGIGTYFFEERYSVKTPKTIEEKKAFAEYLKEKGGEVYFWDKFSVNSNSLQAIYKGDHKEYLEKCKKEGTPEKAALFAIPGLEAPTLTINLKMLSERKK